MIVSASTLPTALFQTPLHGPTIDAAVTEAFFEAIRPAQLDALEAVLAAQAAEGEQLARQWQERLKRSRYEAHLAQRQYDAVDPLCGLPSYVA